MSAGRTLIRYAEFVETFGKIFHLMYAAVEIVELGVLVEAYGKCFHIAAVHTAIGQIALKGD